MILRRIMTGLTAAVVCVFSISMFGVLWRLNECSKDIKLMAGEGTIVWDGRYHSAEIQFKNGIFDRFIFCATHCWADNA